MRYLGGAILHIARFTGTNPLRPTPMRLWENIRFNLLGRHTTLFLEYRVEATILAAGCIGLP